MTSLERIAVWASIACILKFLGEGVQFMAFGHSISFGHADPVIYATILGPLWGAHGYITARVKPNRKMKVDNPDA